MRDTIKNQVYELIGDILVDMIRERPEDIKLTEAGINSYYFIKLGVMLEEEFDIQFTLEEFILNHENGFMTIRSLIDGVEKKMSANQTT